MLHAAVALIIRSGTFHASLSFSDTLWWQESTADDARVSETAVLGVLMPKDVISARVVMSQRKWGIVYGQAIWMANKWTNEGPRALGFWNNAADHLREIYYIARGWSLQPWEGLVCQKC